MIFYRADRDHTVEEAQQSKGGGPPQSEGVMLEEGEVKTHLSAEIFLDQVQRLMLEERCGIRPILG